MAADSSQPGVAGPLHIWGFLFPAIFLLPVLCPDPGAELSGLIFTHVFYSRFDYTRNREKMKMNSRRV
jgi:hypothetical protein